MYNHIIMEIKFDEKEVAKELNCYKIEFNAKPNLMANALNNHSTLVLVVDMINGFCKKGALASERCEGIIAPIKDLLLKLPKAQHVFIRDEHAEDAIEFKSFPPHCHNKDESSVVKELKEFAKNAIDVAKNSTNAFFALGNKVANLGGFANILLVGVCTDICVMQLALTLRTYFNEINSPANVTVITDCVETYDAPGHNANLSNLFSLKFLEQAGVQLFKSLV